MLKKSAATALAIALAASTASVVYAAPANSESALASDPAENASDEQLRKVYEEYHRWRMKNSGMIELEDGKFVRGSSMPSVAPDVLQRHAVEASEFRGKVDAIDDTTLSRSEQVNAIVLRTLLTEQIEDAKFREWEMPFDSDSNFWSYLAPRSGFQSVQEYERYLGRLNHLPRYFAEHTANARSGLARGFSVPKVTLAGRDVSLEAYTGGEVEQNPFWTAFAQMPESIPESERTRLQAQGREMIQRNVIPAFTDLLAFMREEYVPNARETLAAERFPDGKAYYAQQIRQYTTLKLTADAIHDIGLEEVARIENAMREIMTEVGFEGTIAQFNESLRSDPQFIAKTPDELMGVASYVAKRVDGEMGKYFGFLPRHRFSIRPVAPDIAPFYTAGRGGYEFCQMNTYDLPSRPLYNIPALTLHECAPGHSYQAAFQREQGGDDMPAFRRNIYFSGMGEGWGLYTEFLGEEMGIYRTPYEKFGRLSYEMWRAARLVIDTGIHSKGWTREQALSYLGDRTALSRHEVGTEIDRYISWPGQALAYKLGEMQIRHLRKESEEALGDRFDLRKFHDVILALGSVPLPILEARIDRFIEDGGQGLDGIDYP